MLANDDFLGGTPTSLTKIGILPLPFQGTATVIPNSPYIKFTSAEGYVGPVTITYRACADVGMQNVCKTAKVLLTVKGNLAPKPKPDELGVLNKDVYVRSLIRNDAEPELEALLCSTTLVALDPPEAFATATISQICDLTFQANAAYNGPATVTYKVCDNHHLVTPVWPDPAGYGPFDIPGGNAPRCSTAVASMTFEDAIVEPAPPPAPRTGRRAMTTRSRPSPMSRWSATCSPTTPMANIDPDIDGDGIPNDQDPDMDGDGIPNGQDPDVDGDGIPNDQDVDSNSDGVADPEPVPPPSMPDGGTLPATGTSTSSTSGLTSTALALVASGFVLIATTRRRRGGDAVRR